jgi:hypothetical protein
MYKESKIHNIQVKPVVTVEENVKKFKGHKLIPFEYYNLFICSKKRSGKTSLINTIVNATTNKRTTVWCFVSTINIDPTWKSIVKNLQDKGYIVNTFESLMDGKINQLDVIIDELSKGIDEPDNSQEDNKETKKEPDNLKHLKPSCNIFQVATEPVNKDGTKKKVYKPKSRVPQNLFIFDDISTSLRSPSISRLVKIHRHMKASVIISSQYLHDLQPSSHLQLDMFICFKSFSYEKLQYIHKVLDLSIPFEQFWEIYHQCVDEPYSFLYLNVRTEEIRCTFNKLVHYQGGLAPPRH